MPVSVDVVAYRVRQKGQQPVRGSGGEEVVIEPLQ